jgi:hypothetical protein
VVVFAPLLVGVIARATTYRQDDEDKFLDERAMRPVPWAVVPEDPFP